MYPKHFVTGSRGIHVGQVQGVAVPQASGVQALAVVVDRHGAHAEFILAVAVHIGHRDAVVALSRIRVVSILGVKHPTRGERSVAIIPGSDHRAAVPAAHKNSAGQLTIQVSDAGCEPVRSPTRGVVATVAAPAAPTIQRVAGRNVFGRGQGFACGALEHRQVFRSVHNFAVKERRRIERAPVFIGISNDSSGTIDCAISRFADHLRLAIAVEIVDQKLCVGRTGPDVLAQIDAP